ncbi:MAG TPA: manganese catalase family protein [Tepidisphaeraceae bacterium]|jgi:Mn-containing catalase|nr:manganese catalase family protein [Tepidisphaeraceae bacterium]
MFLHDKRLQYHAKPDRPDPLFASKLQEVIGGQWGEMSVMNQYLFQGWNCRGPAKYRDMLLDIATEEIGHVEMLATMVARLLEGADADTTESAAKKSSVVSAVLGGTNPKDTIAAAAMNPQLLIASGQGAMPADSMGNRWTAAYITASGNMLADFRLNVTAESQGRLQVARLYNMTEDKGVRDLLSFLLARDTMHQNQWLAAIEELRADGLEDTPCPSNFPQSQEHTKFSYQFLNFSAGTESSQGRWASGPAPDGKGTFTYVEQPEVYADAPDLTKGADPRYYGTPAAPVPPASK